jgi:hypothetical protein
MFLFSTASSPGLVPTQSSVEWVIVSLSPGVKRPVCEAKHSPPSSAKFKNAWSYTSNSQYVFITWCLVKHGDKFSFTLSADC